MCIYICTFFIDKKGGAWTTPVNVGKEYNKHGKLLLITNKSSVCI